MDPRRAEELVKEDHKKFIAEEKAAGNEVKFEVVNHDKLKFRQQRVEKEIAPGKFKDVDALIFKNPYGEQRSKLQVLIAKHRTW